MIRYDMIQLSWFFLVENFGWWQYYSDVHSSQCVSCIGVWLYCSLAHSKVIILFLAANLTNKNKIKNNFLANKELALLIQLGLGSNPIRMELMSTGPLAQCTGTWTVMGIGVGTHLGLNLIKLEYFLFVLDLIVCICCFFRYSMVSKCRKVYLYFLDSFRLNPDQFRLPVRFLLLFTLV